MAIIKDKIYSVSQGQKIDINTTLGADGFNSTDVGTFVDETVIRAIKANTEVNSQNMANLIADLIYNDKAINAEAEKVKFLLSDGVVRNVYNEFNVTFSNPVTVGLTEYFQDLTIQSGRIKIDDVIIDFPNNTNLNVGTDFADILSAGTYPKYRRDTIQANKLTGALVISQGTERSVDTIPVNSQLDAVDANHYVLYSVLLFQETISSSILVEEVNKLWKYVGLESNPLTITKALLDKDDVDGLYKLNRVETQHITDTSGNLLDYEYGHAGNAPPSIGTKYSEDEISSIEETQLSQDYQALNGSYLTNLPIFIDEIQDDFLARDNISVAGIRFGILNDINSIGQEGIAMKLTEAEPFFEYTASKTFSVTGIQPPAYGGIAELIDSSTNFTTITSVTTAQTLAAGDLVVILDNGVSGKGDFQIGSVVDILSDRIRVDGFTKPIYDGAKYMLFRAATENDVINGETTITNAEIRAQAISGTEGRFGTADLWSKFYIKYPSGSFPTVQFGKMYFLKLKANKDSGAGSPWQDTPHIVIENPDVPDWLNPTIGHNGKVSFFFELTYIPLNGLYPNAYFVIEDEFGNINTYDERRTRYPHFRPAQYFPIAKALDYNTRTDTYYPSDESHVFVDTHTGHIKFAEGVEPRRLYATYNKVDYIQGDSGDASIKHGTDLGQITTQDKFAEIDDRFKNGTTFERSIKINGISQRGSAEMKGPYSINTVNQNKVDLTNPETFNLFNVSDKYMITLSEGYADEIVDLTRNDVSFRSPVLKSTETAAKNGLLVSTVDLHKPPKVGSDWNGTALLPTASIIDSVQMFAKKKFNTANYGQYNIEGDPLYNNPGIVNDDVNGSYDDYFIDRFENRLVLDTLLRKPTYENYFSTNFGVTDKSKNRFFKQRQVLGVMGNDLANLNTPAAILINEKQVTKKDIQTNSVQIGNRAMLRTAKEITNRKFLSVIDSIAETQIGISITSIQDTYYDNGKLFIVYLDPASAPVSNKLKVKVYTVNAPASATAEDIEIGDIVLDGEAYVTITGAGDLNFQTTNAKVRTISDTEFVVYFSYVDTSDVNKTKLGLTRYLIADRSFVSYKAITDSAQANFQVVTSNNFINIIKQNDDQILLAWKVSANASALTYYYPLTSTTSSYRNFTFNDVNYEIKLEKLNDGGVVIYYSSSTELGFKIIEETGLFRLINGNSEELIISSDSIAPLGFTPGIAVTPNGKINFYFMEYTDIALTKVSTIVKSYDITTGSFDPNKTIDTRILALKSDYIRVLNISDTLLLMMHNDDTTVDIISTSLNNIIDTKKTTLSAVSKFAAIKIGPNSFFYSYSSANFNYQIKTFGIKHNVHSVITNSLNTIGTKNLIDVDSESFGSYSRVVARLEEGTTASDRNILIDIFNTRKDGIDINELDSTFAVVTDSAVNYLGLSVSGVNYTENNTLVRYVLVAAWYTASADSVVDFYLIDFNDYTTPVRITPSTPDLTMLSITAATINDLQIKRINNDRISVVISTSTNGVKVSEINCNDLLLKVTSSPYIVINDNFASAFKSLSANPISSGSIKLKGLRYDNATSTYQSMAYSFIATNDGQTIILDTDVDPLYDVINNDTVATAAELIYTPRSSFSMAVGNLTDYDMFFEDNKFIASGTKVADNEIELKFGTIDSAFTSFTNDAVNSGTYRTGAITASKVFGRIVAGVDNAFVIAYKGVPASSTFKIDTFIKTNKTTEVESYTHTTTTKLHLFDGSDADVFIVEHTTNTTKLSSVGLMAPLWSMLNFDTFNQRLDRLGNFKTNLDLIYRIYGTDFATKEITNFVINESIDYEFDNTNPHVSLGTMTNFFEDSTMYLFEVSVNIMAVIWVTPLDSTNCKIKIRKFNISSDNFIIPINDVTIIKDFVLDPFEKIYMGASLTNGGDELLVNYSSKNYSQIQSKILSDEGIESKSATIDFNYLSVPGTRDIQIKGQRSLIGGYHFILAYDGGAEELNTILLSPTGLVVNPNRTPFSHTYLDFTNDVISEPYTDVYGNTFYTYIRAGDLFYAQHGFDGNITACCAVVGKMEIENAIFRGSATFDGSVTVNGTVETTESFVLNQMNIIKDGTRLAVGDVGLEQDLAFLSDFDRLIISATNPNPGDGNDGDLFFVYLP